MLALIGFLEFISLLVIGAGLFLIVFCLAKKRPLKMAIGILISGFIMLILFVTISEKFFFEEMEKIRIESESRQAADESSKAVKESTIHSLKDITTENSLTEYSHAINNSVHETSLENAEDTDPVPETIPVAENLMESTEETTELSGNEKLMEDLKTILSEDIANKAYDIIVNQIGFTEVNYIGVNSVGTTNYDFKSKGYDFTVTASDDVYRIFQPNGGVTFYADSEVKMTVSDVQDRSIDHNDRVAYYMIAQMIVEEGLKSPRSAKFPSIVTRPEEIRMSKNKDLIAVQSYVDAENSFGASIRSQWTVEYMVIDIKSFLYEPVYVNIDGNVLYGEYIELD